MSIYITGDVHGDSSAMQRWCEIVEPDKNDIIVILGDAGLNYFGGERDRERKMLANSLGSTIFCIHGNHEMRPEKAGGYETVEWHGASAWAEPEFAHLMFAKDGEIYDLGGEKAVVLGGAYSTDKHFRLAYGYRWFEDEQPSDAVKRLAEETLAGAGWKVPVVLSHTCPYKYRPIEAMRSGISQSKVDTSTEEWLDRIEERLDYRKWYCGHWHINKRVDKVEFLFHDIRILD